MKSAIWFAAAVLAPCAARDGWWMREPIRWVQTNLRETDAALDPVRLADQLAEFRANVLLFGMGGITAYYPAKVEFHYASPYLPPGRDTFGEMVREAHKRGIRVVGRFDLSKTQKAVFDARPEWFFKQASGEPVVYNGLYSVCINGGYYREHARKILGEALDRYEVDGLFFNMFGNQSTDYSGRFVGHCHCGSCQRRFRERFGRNLPEKPDEDYRRFLHESTLEVAAEISALIQARRPAAGFFTYVQEHTDGIMSESNTAVGRPLPLWPYASSDNVNRARNSQPGKMSINLCMSFIDFPWRFATVPPAEIALRIWQNVAHGGAAALNMHGTMDQQDRSALIAARPIYRWLAEHEGYYAGQESAARVLLLGGARGTGRSYSQSSYRGLFRLLTEEHIPFAVSDNLEWLGKREFDLVIASDWAPAGLQPYAEQGGHVLLASSRPPEFPVARVVERHSAVKGYWRIRDHSLLPSLQNTQLIMLNGEYTEVEASGMPPLTLVPPSMFGPPEKVHVDQKDTTKPGLVLAKRGKGSIAWLPWDIGNLYYLHGSHAHAGLLRDLIDHLLSGRRQLYTNAHPLVEFSLMRRGGRLQLHLVNVSGHSQTAYFAPLPVLDVRIRVAARGTKVSALRLGQALAARQAGEYLEFVLPRLEDYELLLIE